MEQADARSTAVSVATMAAEPEPVEAPQGTRLILATEDLMTYFASYTEDGCPITFEWGEPDEHGWYAPTFTITATERDQQERFKWRANERADRAVAALQFVLAFVAEHEDHWLFALPEQPAIGCNTCATALGPGDLVT